MWDDENRDCYMSGLRELEGGLRCVLDSIQYVSGRCGGDIKYLSASGSLAKWSVPAV